MKRTFRFVLIILMLLTGSSLYAEDRPVAFNDQVLEERYYALIEEIRCLVCQNQSLADSHADLAQDLRNEIYQMIVAGDEDKQIVQFLVERYGDFVLYRPPLQENTWLLWFGPFLFLFITVVIAILLVRKQANENVTKMSEEEQRRLAEIIDKDLNGNNK